MEQNSVFRPVSSPVEKEDTIDIKLILFRILQNWHWFVLCAVVGFALSFIVNRYAPRIYETSAVMLIEDEDKNSYSPMAGMDLTQGFSMMPGMQNFDNQLIIIKSYSNILNTLEKLDFEVEYYNKGRVQISESYEEDPFIVEMDKNHIQPIGVRFKAALTPEGNIRISADSESATLFDYRRREIAPGRPDIIFSQEVEPGHKLYADFLSFTVKLREGYVHNNNGIVEYYFQFTTNENLTEKYQQSLQLEPISKNATLVNVTMQSTVPQKAR
ncbi:MAG: Wzz/FepE/Etk N-terminal domain-containing protein, partial [Bacteroidales bacterium]|nr:Wzz/FepE/Etk N-terminal domain-containing protein [Bacteroidales bacterium]